MDADVLRGISSAIIAAVGVICFGCASGHTKPAYGAVGFGQGLMLTYIITVLTGISATDYVWIAAIVGIVASCITSYLFLLASGRLTILSIGLQSGFFLPFYIYTCFPGFLIGGDWHYRLIAPILTGIIFAGLLFWRDERLRIPAGGFYAANTLTIAVSVACNIGLSNSIANVSISDDLYKPIYYDYFPIVFLIPLSIISLYFQRWFRTVVIKPPSAKPSGDLAYREIEGVGL